MKRLIRAALVLLLLSPVIVSCDVLGIPNPNRCWKCMTTSWSVGKSYPTINKEVCGDKQAKAYEKENTGTVGPISYRTMCTIK